MKRRLYFILLVLALVLLALPGLAAKAARRTARPRWTQRLAAPTAA